MYLLQLDPSNKGARKAFEAVKVKMRGGSANVVSTTAVPSEASVDELDVMMGTIKSVREKAASLGDTGRRDAAANAAMRLWEMIGEESDTDDDDK
jgi:hypothetical protein